MPARFHNEEFLEDLSLATFICKSHKKAKFPPVKEALGELAINLTDKARQPAVHKFSVNDKIDHLLDRMRAIPIEDFIAHHQRLVLPFDEFWIEQTEPVYESKRKTRFGVLIKKDPRKPVFRAKFAMEVELLPDQDVAKDILVMDRYVRGKRTEVFVSATNIEIIFSPKGIRLDARAASLKKMFQKGRTGIPEEDNFYQSFQEHQLQQQIDAHMLFAQDIYRLLLILSSHNVRSNLTATQSAERETIARQGKDTRYREPSLPPMAVLTPISVDLSKEMKSALARKDSKGIKALLGWTDVMRFLRHYHTRDGVVEMIIEPHERRIAAPIDRRGAPRAITSSTPDLNIKLNTDRPRLIHGKRRRGAFTL